MVAEAAFVTKAVVDAQRSGAASPAVVGEEEVGGEDVSSQEAIGEEGADEHLV